MTTRFTLISHATTQAQRRVAFPADEALDEREFARISALGWSAPRTQQILVAPELRAQQTANALGLTFTTIVDLRDCDYGKWSGCEFDDLYLEDPQGITTWLTDPSASPHGGESIANLIERVGCWLNTYVEAGHIVAVTHPAVIRSAIVHALNAPFQSFWRIDIAPLTLTDLRFNGSVWTLRSVALPLRTSDSETT